MVLGLTFQNYRKTQIASRALQITVFMQHTHVHLNRNELLAKLTLTKTGRRFLKIKWFAIKQLKNSPFIFLMWKHKE